MAFLSKHSSDVGEKGNELTLVIGIESGIVRGSLVLFNHGGDGAAATPHVFHTASAEIVPREGNARVKLLSAMLDAVTHVSENIAVIGLKITTAAGVTLPISKIHIVFSSPWIISKTKTVKISYEKETEITKAIVDAILDGERRELEERFMAEHDKTLEFDLSFVEQKIFEVKLNGYPTAHFEGKEARELETSFVISISAKSILSSVEKAIEKSIRTAKQKTEYHSSLLLQYSALRSIVKGAHDYIVVHVHHEISDLIVVKKGLCSAMVSFPQGTGLLSRESSAALGQSKEIAHSTLNLHAKNAFHSTEERRVATIAQSGTSAWTQQFKDALASVGAIGTVPHRVYLLTNVHYSHFEHSLREAGKPEFEVVPIEKNLLDSAISHQNKEREDALMSLYVFSLS